jgi:hypothetical protein
MNLITQGLGPDDVYDAPDPQGGLLIVPPVKEPAPPENGQFG